jgi:hypothetical protein
LAITQILKGFRGLILTRTKTKVYWPCVLWAVLLLVIDVQSWWAMYGLRAHSQWNFLAFAVVLTQTILQYLQAGLVLPDVAADKPTDLREHYFDHTHWFFGVAIAVTTVSIFKDVILDGKLPEPLNLGSQLIFIAACAIALVTANERYHKFLAVFSAVLIVAYIGVLFRELQ